MIKNDWWQNKEHELTKEGWAYIVFDGDLFEIIYDETAFENSEDIQAIRRWYEEQEWT